MPRNAEVIRQWTLLREIESARLAGLTIDELARVGGVTTRTIRRDLEALQQAGFPLFDDRSNDDGRTRWRFDGLALKGLAAGLTLSELSALYFSRALVEALAWTPFRADVERAFAKLSEGLTPHMRRYLDQLPQIIATKRDPMRKHDDPRIQQIVWRIVDAVASERETAMTYHSAESGRTKKYIVHPYRLAYAQGGIYLLAYVPDYEQVRTFAVERIESFALLEQTFRKLKDLPAEVFADSLGVHSGPPERVVIAFLPRVAGFVRAREWHPSQKFSEGPDGGTIMTLSVCADRALKSWILGFGPSARIIAPKRLVQEIASMLGEARSHYD